MCMKYINAIVTPYKSVDLTPTKEILSLAAPLRTVKASVVEGQAVLEDFSIVTDISFLGTTEDKHKDENPVVRGETINFAIRLTKCARDPEKRIYVDLDRFSVDLSAAKKENLADQACFDFYSYTRVTEMTEVLRHIPTIDGKALIGKYVLKLVIVTEKEEIVQSITALDVIDADKEPEGQTITMLWKPFFDGSR